MFQAGSTEMSQTVAKLCGLQACDFTCLQFCGSGIHLGWMVIFGLYVVTQSRSLSYLRWWPGRLQSLGRELQSPDVGYFAPPSCDFPFSLWVA